ncbi:hypothetical protein M0R45_018523 [Rubus argutus]|uniref:MHD1 domain-containing protein n=1 Tax=Rubus argutus TaxID=59490 RepID=A0AAW1X2Q7_RUBAR
MGVVTTPTSRIKRALGLKMLKRSPSRRMGSSGGGRSSPSSPNGNSNNERSPGISFTAPPSRPRRPMTSAEIMRQQMRVTEQSDSRLRKTLMRTLVGQMGRRAETIILPLELLRHLKPSEFNDSHEYHQWQKRQLKILEAGLLHHPSIPLDRSNTFAMRLREIIRSVDSKTIGHRQKLRHNANPLQLSGLIIVAELQRNPNEYVSTAQIEPDLLCGAHAMLAEVANNAKRPDREAIYVKILSAVLSSMQAWAEKKLLRYHEYFQRGTVGQIENLLPLALSSSKILGEDVSITDGAGDGKGDITLVDNSGDRVDYYIRSSMKQAFTKIMEVGNFTEVKAEAVTEALLQLAKDTEDLACKERESFSPILKRWHTTAAGIAAVTLHNCYGAVLKQYLNGVSTLTADTVEILQRAAKLEKVLLQMVVEDSAECEDGGKAIVREMVPYEVDTIIVNLLKKWIYERMKKGKECVNRAKESETWNPKSKSEPYAQSAEELMKLAKEIEYTAFVASCGSKQSYIPTLPPLTRCNRDSKFLKLWKKASPCSIGAEDFHPNGTNEGHHPRPSTSRGTQRLYIRLNTLHYLLSHLHSLDKNLALSPRIIPSTPRSRYAKHRRANNSSSYFEITQASIQAACQHVSEVAAYRLIFLDSNSVFYESLYVGDVANARIRPALRILKQNLTLLGAFSLIERRHWQ